MSKNCEIKQIANKGVGVFALKDFKIGEVVIVGKIIKHLKSNSKFASQIDIDKFVLHNKLSRKVNHSCSPNCGIKVNATKAHDLVAIRNIKIDEEITYDYAMRNYRIEYFGINCFCGSKECRTFITGWKDLSDTQKMSYINHVVPYLLEISENQ